MRNSVQIFCLFIAGMVSAWASHAQGSSPSESSSPSPSATHSPAIMPAGSAESMPATTGTVAPPQPQAQPQVPELSKTTQSASTTGVAPSAGEVLENYRRRELYTRYAAWSGQDLMRGGKSVELGYFGGNFESIFAGSPAALEEVRKFRTQRIIGTTFYATGLAILITEFVLILAPSNFLVEKDSHGHPTDMHAGPFAVMALSGTALGLTGALLMQGANGYLSDAVDRYNADLARQLGAQATLGRRSPMLRLGGVF